MDLTVGPNQFFWDADLWQNFYARIANKAPVQRVVLGELICSKRLPFYQTRIPETVERLTAAGKQVAMTSLALITLRRERKLTAELVDMGLEVEVNDLSALELMPPGLPFSVGPLVNVYNEGTLRWLAGRGATRVCLPPELTLDSVQVLAATGATTVEVWGWGRLPLAISGRCYHARLHDRAKDSCQFVCADDPDGRDVDTLDGQEFLAINGVQTLSARCANLAPQLPALRRAGVGALRLSPQSQGFVEVTQMFRDLIDGRIEAEALAERARPHAPGGAYCDGYPGGGAGVAWSGRD